jgi:hypothetical protein
MDQGLVHLAAWAELGAIVGLSYPLLAAHPEPPLVPHPGRQALNERGLSKAAGG